MSDRRGGDAPRVRNTPWHWVTAALGLGLLVATVAFLVYDGFVRRRIPHPVLSVAVDTVAATAHGHVVRFHVRNDGGVAAATVVVRARLRAPDGALEEAEATLDYVPPMSSREAGVVLEGDPRTGRLELRAAGFEIP